MLEVAIALFTAALGGAAGYLYSERRAQKLVDRARLEAEEEFQTFLEQEKQKLETKLREELEREITRKKEEELKDLYRKLEEEKVSLERLKLELELKREEIERLQQRLKEEEKRIEERSQVLEKKWETLEEREEELFKRYRELQDLEKQLLQKEKEVQKLEEKAREKLQEIEEVKNRQLQKLQEIANLSYEQAKEELFKVIEEKERQEIAKLLKKMEEEAKEQAKQRARDILLTALERLAPEATVHFMTTTVQLPSNEFKGRIIGREGRNIRTFEQLTGVDVIIDDTPDVVTLSSFDPLRREIAKEALERLIADGRIHPASIEKTVEEVKKEFDEKLRKLGEEVCQEFGLYDINPGLHYYIGKLFYRTSYTQNVLNHSKEVAQIAGMLAAELGLDVKKAQRAGLLHDIGKAVSHELGESHTKAGADLAKKYGEPDYVINAIFAHHEEEEPRYPEVVLVCIADKLSAARPGARRETLEKYIKRLEKIEEIVKSFKGVQNAYAIQAGREVRVIVNPEDVSEEEAFMISKEIAKRLEKEIDFPAQIKVTVIRETRYVQYTR
ncbi:MAG TPA: ribonuclease Y [Aquifex aeolicus]|uniref:Ribonuclease Y n=1 Tax=Aquifex aeolicus TaxID=63363 RepID=A0A9D0YPG8_AQUAO|nr:ribonuclease Y [Aquificales bacterium]HIP98412.1 ribonuclease Y [Aquifex aeolicus]HIQ26409.1 ribonuclease Y [Aquifex aeolicus]